MRNGAEIWIDIEVADKLDSLLEGTSANRFVKVGDNTLNTADITSILTPEEMVEINYRKNGMWKCKHGTWHNRYEQCACASLPPKWCARPLD